MVFKSEQNIEVEKTTPGVQLDGLETNGEDVTLRENAGALEVYDNTASAVQSGYPVNTHVGPSRVRVPLADPFAFGGIDATVTGRTAARLQTDITQAELESASSIILAGARTAAGGGESVDIELYDVTAATQVASITLSGASERTTSADISGSLTAGNNLRARVNVTTAAGSGTFDVPMARLVLE